MDAFKSTRAIATPLPRDNVDTDIIIPAGYLKAVSRKGLGVGAFRTLRFEEDGRPRADSVFNDPRFTGSSILAVGDNFGCGSSREHAAWALHDLGFRVVIGESFADIFASNAFKNGILTISLPKDQVRAIMDESEALRPIGVDLEAGRISLEDGRQFAFETDPFRRRCLLEGLDEVGLTLRQHADTIGAFEQKRAATMPWFG